MRTIINIVLITCFIAFSDTIAQKVSISGIIKDKESGEPIPFSNVTYESENRLTTADRYGRFVVYANQGKNTLSINAGGYKGQEFEAYAGTDTVITVELEKVVIQLNAVTIKFQQNSIINQHGSFRLTSRQIKELPTIFAEPDVLKSLQLLPGVQAGTEGSVGLHVRGGSPDQNLILLDGVPVYNINHLFGFFSVINPDIISSVDLYKNEMPARYGGRLSSVTDITLREGNMRKHKANFQIGLISTKALIEGPIKKDTASFIISARRSWLDILAGAIQSVSPGGASLRLGFYDLSGKINYKFDQKNHLFFSTYFGRDSFKNRIGDDGSHESQNRLRWGNATGILRWNHQFNSTLAMNSSLSYTNFRYQVETRYETQSDYYRSRITSNIQDYTASTSLLYKPSHLLEVDFGANFASHQFNPKIEQVKNSGFNEQLSDNQPRVVVNDTKIYAEGSLNLFGDLNLKAGANFNVLMVGKKVYSSFQPRLSAKYSLAADLSIYGSYYRTVQYLHLLSNSSLGLPTDLWVPVTESLKPELADQISTGINGFHLSHNWSVGLYQKQMSNLLEYVEGASFLNAIDADWSEKVTSGNGNSRGVEVFVQKPSGTITYFLSYTLSRTDRLFKELNNGTRFPYKYDRKHLLNASIQYHFSKERSIQALFSLNSGGYLTFPVARTNGLPFPATGVNNTNFSKSLNALSYLPDRNNLHMPIYHRLDLSYRSQKQKKHGVRTWTFSVYNIYNNKNLFYIFVQNGRLKELSLLPIIPAVSYEFQF